MKTLKRCHFLLAVIIIIGFAITACAEPERPRLSGTVSIFGTAYVGETLTANTNSLSGKGSVTFKWKRENVKVGANSATYVVQEADLGSTITVTVTCSDNSGSITSRPTAVVVVPPLYGTVSISGTAQPGRTITANTSNLGGTGDISYQWMRDETVNIGENSRTYLVQEDDNGSTITVTVTRSGCSGSITSRQTTVGYPTLSGTVRITGSAYVGQTLTANTSNLGGSGVISYRWMLGGTVSIGDNRNTYLLQTADAGYTVTVTVTRAGYTGSITSDPTATVTVGGGQPSGDFVKKVEFTGSTATVSFDNLSNNNIFLVKINKSASTANSSGTGSVQNAVLPSSESVRPPLLSRDDRPRMGHPRATELKGNRPPIDRRERSEPRANFIPPVVGETRTFWVDEPYTWRQIPTTLLATGTYGNIWVNSNSITTQQAQALSNKFDIIYPAETNILGFEYGGGPNGNGGKDGDPKIQILVYNIGGGILGYFWDIDFYEQSELGSSYRTNLAEIFYLNSNYVGSNPELIYLTLSHEFQHMINFNRKYVEKGVESDVWFDETMSMLTEDIMADIIGVPMTHEDHPIRDHVPYFLENYTRVGFSEWDVPSDYYAYPYSKGWTFGAYLMRNYGGADLLRRILNNNAVDTASITAALNEIEPGMTFEKALIRFGEAMIFSGNAKPANVLTFDKTVTTTVTGHNGTHTYTLPAFDIWNIGQGSYNYSTKGPVVYSTAQRNMRGHTVLLQQDNAWRNKSGSFSITLNKPSNDNVELYLMVR